MYPSYDEKLTLDRINNDGNYEPNNCHWATRREQNRNQRSNRLITFNDKTQLLIEWAEELGINYHTLYGRIYAYKMPLEKALRNVSYKGKYKRN